MNLINTIELELLKANFTNAKYIIIDKVSVIIAKFLAVLSISLYLITKKRFLELSIILSSDFM